ncbi:U32 family peptidase [Collinsella intestinalis]|uniref:U32 family peptidase n=1 Tax=Collinsella intestinalis TaxID=147207 RepID=UPI001EF42020|nr:U32 family peptidase [Collinsella intestinalis]
MTILSSATLPDARPTHELLSPAGGPEAFRAALAAGADAIYCGMGSFNARRKATNFTDDAFETACREAHLAGARVYVTVNIVIKESELPRALALIERCTVLGADAFIIQDWGLFAAARALMPTVETHISTQANIHDARGTRWCRDAGADRVTLSRELSVAEIAQIHEAVPDVDLEVFAHGSICFSYSGICLLSSFACAGRSANRGMCAQPCRLPYELVDENTGRVLTPAGRERALCPRDTNTSEMLEALLGAGAHALKLEGRMKAPDYVFAVTDAYRRALDDAEAGRQPAATERAARARQLKRCFNRDFTHAYQDGRSDDDMMSYERSNNRGQTVGEVVGFAPRRARTKGESMRDAARGAKGLARIRLDEPVGAGDLLELRHDREPDRFLTGLVRADAPAGSTIEVEVARPMPVGCTVRLIRSQHALDVAAAALKRPVARKRAVDVTVSARLGEPFTVTLTCVDDPALTATATGFVVEAARSRAVTADDLVEHVGRMGSSPFEAASFDIALDEGAGMGFSAVHRVRADACAALEEAVLAPHRARAAALDGLDIDEGLAAMRLAQRPGACTVGGTDPVICALATTLEAAEAARAAGATRLYLPTDVLDEAGITPDEAQRRGLIPVLDEVSRACDLPRLDRWVLPGAPVAVGTISELALAAERGAAAELRSCIPVHNTLAGDFLAAQGARGAWLSPELTLAELEEILPASPLVPGIMVYGRPRVMTSEHCILQVADACCHNCARCALRRRELSLRNIDGKRFPVRTDAHGRSRLYTDRPVDLTPQLPQLIGAGVERLLVDGTLLSAEELSGEVARVRRALDAPRRGQRPGPREPGSFAGCLFVGVD